MAINAVKIIRCLTLAPRCTRTQKAWLYRTILYTQSSNTVPRDLSLVISWRRRLFPPQVSPGTEKVECTAKNCLMSILLLVRIWGRAWLVLLPVFWFLAERRVPRQIWEEALTYGDVILIQVWCCYDKWKFALVRIKGALRCAIFPSCSYHQSLNTIYGVLWVFIAKTTTI